MKPVVKKSLGAIFSLALAFAGCAQDCPSDYREVEERGYIRCGYENPDEMTMPIRCDISKGEHCCTWGPDITDRGCTTAEECLEIQEETPGTTGNMECDEPTDCQVLYPGEGKDWCCSSFVNEITVCEEECPIIALDQNPNCLSTWNCPSGQVCIVNIYVPDMYYCEKPKE